MFGFGCAFPFRRRPGAPLWDIHCHLLPGVDDGVKDDATALQCLQAMAGRHFRGAVLTPHIYPEVFDNDEDDLRQRFDAFAGRMATCLPDFELALGAEYFCDASLPDRIGSGRVLAFGPASQYVLIELPVMMEPESLEPAMQRCRQRGLTPVIAHIERYRYLHGDDGEQLLGEWREAGALLQVNLGSVVGQYGREMRRWTRRLLQHGWVDLLGTDLHGPEHLATVKSAWNWLASKRGADAWVQRHRALTDASPVGPAGGVGGGGG